MSKVVSFDEVQTGCKNSSWVQITRFTSEGEVLSEITVSDKKQNGSGFVLSYTEQMSDFLVKCSTGSVVRVFLYLAHHQQYGVDNVYGFRCSHKGLQQILNLDKKSVYNALTKLKEDFLVHELRVAGVSEFMVNPNYVTIGKDKKARLREWNLRWANTFKSQGKVSAR